MTTPVAAAAPLTIGTTYAVTYEPRPDPRRAPRFVTRRLRLVETFTTSGTTYYRFKPAKGTGYAVVLAAAELLVVE